MEGNMSSGTWVLPSETYSARVTGACLCGAVRWSYDAPFATMLHCHCTVCRKHHGSLFASVVVGPLTTFHWRDGTGKIGTWASSPRERRSFCTICGSKVPRVDTVSQRVFMPAGALEGELGIKPQMRIFVGSRPAWHEVHDSLPRYEAYPPVWDAAAYPTPVRAVNDGVVGGSCACDQIRYELTGSAMVMRHCHCGRCRRARGAAHATNLAWPLDALRYVTGEEAVVAFKLPTAEHFGQSFCRSCGGVVPHRSPARGFVVVPASALDSDPGIHPSVHAFVQFKAPWFDITDGVPQFPEAAPLPRPS
jgi:hypothetical protein